MIVKLLVLFFSIYISAQNMDDVDDTNTSSPFVVANPTSINAFQSIIDDNVGFVFGIPCSNRAEWDVRKNTISKGFLSTGLSLLGTPQPAWSNTAYLDYYTSGSRALGQDMIAARYTRLLPLALAECYYWNGSFADQLNQELLSIANQPTWVWPYHDKNKDSFYGREHFVELGSSFTVGYITMALGLVDTKINPDVRTLLKQRLTERITQPVLNSIAAVTTNPNAQTKNFWMNANSNWNSVCWTSTVISASMALDDKGRRAKIYAHAFANGNDYMNVFTRDGWDTEGMLYWNGGFGEYIVLRESLLRVTDNAFDLLNNPIARIASRYPNEAALFTESSVSTAPDFGDCPPEWATINLNLKAYLSFALGVAQQQGKRVAPPTNKAPGIVIGMFSDINQVVVLPRSESDPVYTSNSLRSFFSNPGILITRSSADSSPAGLSAAFKLLGNEGIHSHNDIGSYEIYLNGLKITGEPGGVNYTANSFGSTRFNSEFFNSIGHPVPKVKGQQQIEAATRTTNIRNNGKVPSNESISFSDSLDSITYDLTGAYNNVPSLTSLKRIIKFSREIGNSYVSIEDQFSFSTPSTFETALIAPSAWDLNSKLFWNTDAPNSQLLLTTFSTSNTAFRLSSSTITSKEYKRTIQRIALIANGLVTSGSIGYKFTPQFRCQNNQFLDSSSNNCITCSNGAPSVDGTECICNAGYFFNSTQKLCLQCGSNQFSLAGSTSCGSCLYSSTSQAGSSYCTTSAGKYWDLTKNAVAWCPDGTFSLAGAFQCTSCPSGKNSTTYKQSCICEDGYAFNSATVTCDICPPNTYAKSGATTCSPCLYGSSNTLAGSSSCVAPAGKYWDLTRNAVAWCADGTYSSSSGATQCTLCPTGSRSSAGKTTCICPAGYSFNSVNNSCEVCPAGFFSSAGTTCSRCPFGKTSPIGATSSSACK